MGALLAEIRSHRVQPSGLGPSLSHLWLRFVICAMKVSIFFEVQDQILGGQGQASSEKS